MTALAGIMGPDAADAQAARKLILDMPRRGDGPVASVASEQFTVALQSFDWERDLAGWTGPQLLTASGLAIAADASLYYVADLRARLRHFADVGELTIAQLIAMAARCWGTRFARYLEGDFAFVVYDQRRRTLLLARDFAGKRSLAYARASDGSYVFASSARAVANHRLVSAALDLDVLAAAAAGLMAHGERTAFTGVRMVPAGATVLIDERGGARVVDRWNAPSFSDTGDGTPFNEAALELRRLLETATLERLPRRGVAVTWLSGGWDSPAVFAAGRSALNGSKRDVSLLPVSLSYPEGDRGRENDHIERIAAMWNTRTTWIDVDHIALFTDVERRMRLRDDPVAHAFESQQRVLAQVSRTLGARIVLDGYGGDQLFVSSSALLVDLLLSGRWGRFARLWRRRRDRSIGALLRLCLTATLTNEALDWLGSVRGRRVRGYWDGIRPDWMTPRASLDRDARPQLDRVPTESVAAFEQRYLLTNPFFPRVSAWNHAFALDEGIQLRSPLYDPRIITFAAGRPVRERNHRGDTKLLLRAAMHRSLPASVLAPRPRKTGITVDYFARQLRSAVETVLRPRLVPSAGSLALADLALVDPAKLAAGLERYAATGDHLLGSQLLSAFQVESWLARTIGKS